MGSRIPSHLCYYDLSSWVQLPGSLRRTTHALFRPE